MKYESELIKEIVETRGHEKSPIHYESECIEKWIEETKGAYPKLCDYQSEWLDYINKIDGGGAEQPNPNPPIGEFPYVVLSDVTEATIDNVVPYAYKSAILKGQTLVNLLANEYSFVNLPTMVEVELNSVVNKYDATDNRLKTIKLNQNLQANKKYILLLNVVSLENGKSIGGFMASTSNEQDYNIPRFSNTGLQYKIFETKFEVKEISLYLDFNETTPSIAKIKQPILMEYQEGMENWDIPYFEGMQSVQMPVLQTTGKNLWRTDFIVGKRLNEEGNVTTGSNYACIDEYIKILPKTSYVISNSITKNGVQIFEYDSNKNLLNISWAGTGSITTQAKTEYFRYSALLGGGNNSTEEALRSFQFEQGTVATSYEPYKSIILTVNEPIELRGIGEVKDELDLLTRKLTQRIDEDGSVLTQEVVKTVELLVQNQDGNTLSVIKPIEGKMQLSTSSDTIKPLFSGEIPVEAITQNLASFIDLEMEE